MVSPAWDSYQHAARLTLVAKQWIRPVQSVAYRAISLRGQRQATRFARTARDRADLAARVRWLSLGLGEALEMTIPEVGQTPASLALSEAGNLCPNVRHFHFRPMAVAVREQLKSFLSSRPLESICVAPRVADPLRMRWCHGLTEYGDFMVPHLSALKRLEGDMYCLPPPCFERMLEEARLFSYPAMQIRLLRFDSDMPTVWLLKLIKATGPTLEVLDIYHEQMIDVDEAYDALLPATKSLVRLRWRMNPFLSPYASTSGSRSPSPTPSPTLSAHLDSALSDIADADAHSDSLRPPASLSASAPSLSPSPLPDTRPLFDRLLPQFTRLERLHTSSDAISVNLVGVVLPERLRHIEVQAFEGEGVNPPAEEVRGLLEAPVGAKGTREVGLTLVGNRRLWTEEVRLGRELMQLTLGRYADLRILWFCRSWSCSPVG